MSARPRLPTGGVGSAGLLLFSVALLGASWCAADDKPAAATPAAPVAKPLVPAAPLVPIAVDVKAEAVAEKVPAPAPAVPAKPKEPAGPGAVPAPPKAVPPAAGEAKPTDTKAADSKPAAADTPPADKPAPDAKPAKRPNPLNDLFKGIIGKVVDEVAKPAVAPAPGIPSAPVDKKAEEARAKRSSVDPRAPFDVKNARRLRQAITDIGEKRWKTAVDLLHDLQAAPDYEDSLYPRTPTEWVSIRDEARRTMATLPDDVLREYRTRFAGLARELLLQAGRKNDIREVANVAQRYMLTDAGAEAAQRMVMHYLDHRQYSQALRYATLLEDVKSPVVKDRDWQARIALVHTFAGNSSAAKKIAADLGDQQAVSIGGSRVSLEGLWKSLPGTSGGRLPELDEWLTMFGNVRRAAHQLGGEPLLIPRWKLPITESDSIQQQLRFLHEDVVDSQSVPVGVFAPITVGGKVVFRSIRGVDVVESATGRLLWTTGDASGIERTMSTQNPSTTPTNSPVFMRRATIRYGSGGQNDPVANLVYRNANFGSVSSDGQRIFFTHDTHALTTRQAGQVSFGWDGQEPVPSYNSLMAYDLRSGRPLWEVGGAAHGDAYDLPLAGHFFFGSPLADGSDLYAVAEFDGQIRLVVLDAASGKPKWTQLIAMAEATVGTDIGRRWWSAPVSIAGGVIICPTTVGWVTAVDSTTRSLLWGRRVVPAPARTDPNAAEANNIQQAVAQMTPLNGRWVSTPPIIHGNRVLCAMPESQALFGLDLGTGKVVFEVPRGEQVLLAGVSGNAVLSLSRTQLTAYLLADGKPKWTIDVPTAVGRGVVVNKLYHHPAINGELWSIDTETGAVQQKLFLPDDGGSLGNLVMYRGVLLSVSTLGVTAFEQRNDVEAEIARRRQTDPLDLWSHVREAEVLISKRDFTAVRTVLAKVSKRVAQGGGEVTDDLRQRYANLNRTALVAVIRQKLGTAEAQANLDELRTASVSPNDLTEYRRLFAEHSVAAGEWSDAISGYFELISQRSDQFWQDPLQPALKMRADLWLSSQLAGLWAKLPEGLRPDLARRVKAELQKAAAAELPVRERLLVLFGQLPVADEARFELAKSYASKKDFARADAHLIALSRSGDAAVQVKALLERARLRETFGQYLDADRLYHMLVVRHGTQSAGDDNGTPVKDYVASHLAGRKASTSRGATIPAGWQADSVRMERSGHQYYGNVTRSGLWSVQTQSLFYRHVQLDYPVRKGRLELLDAQNADVIWSAPIRSRMSGNESQGIHAEVLDHMVFVNRLGVLHAISPVDQTTLWTRTFDERIAPQAYNNYSYSYGRQPITPMQRFRQVTSDRLAALPYRMDANNNTLSSVGSMPVANEEVVVLQGRRAITVLDALTGEERWVLGSVRPGTLVRGVGQYLIVRDATGTTLRSALDGRVVPHDKLATLLQGALDVVDGKLLVCEQNVAPGMSQAPQPPVKPGTPATPAKPPVPEARLALIDLATQQPVWTRHVPSDALYSLLSRKRMAVVRGGVKTSVIDLATGEENDVGEVPKTGNTPFNPSEWLAFADFDSLVVIGNTGGGSYYYSDGIPILRTSGTVFGFDMRGKRPVWSQKLANFNLLFDEVDQCPWLLFATQKSERRGNQHISLLNFVVVDKQTGAKLVDQTVPSYFGFRSLTVSQATKSVEVRSYNERWRFVTEQKNAAAAPMPNTPAVPTGTD